MATQRSVDVDTRAVEGDAAPFAEIAPGGRVCGSCGHVHERGRFRPGCPGPRLQDGRRSAIVQRGSLPAQADAIAALADRQREIEEDLGGSASLSRLHRDAVRDYLRLELVSDFLFDRLVREGPLTGKGRTRAALGSALAVEDRKARLRVTIGLARRVRAVDPRAEIERRVAALSKRRA